MIGNIALKLFKQLIITIVFVGFVESKKFGWKKPNGDFKSYDKDAYLNSKFFSSNK